MTIIGRRPIFAAGILAVAVTLTTACGAADNSAPAGGSPKASAETNPAGDIPDSQVYVPFTPPGGLFTVSVPEGWSRSSSGAATIFTDKSNTVRIDMVTRASAPTVDSVTTDELPAIKSASLGYVPDSVTTVQRASGRAVLITYQATSGLNPVTGKTVTEAVQRYEFWRAGNEVILTLSGPAGADNVDPWRTVTDSLRWTQ